MRPGGAAPTPRIYLALLAAFVVLVVLYVNGRYDWTWVNDDAIVLTKTSRNVYVEATLSPKSKAYQFGFAYPAVNTFMAQITGQPIEGLQDYVQPFLVVVLVPLSFIAFRGITGSTATGVLAALLLFLQPEFLFEVLRSSHAKVTWSMALAMVFLLSRSLTPGHGRPRIAVWVILFYLAAFAAISSNSFFASSYVFGLALVFAGTRVAASLRRYEGDAYARLGRLWLVVVSCLVLVFVFIFYLYEPALTQFRFLKHELDKLAVLLFGAESEGAATLANPYAYVGGTWTSFGVYLFVSSANWLVLVLSFGRWLALGWHQVRHHQTLAPQRALLWWLYPAFALLLATAVALDFLGLLSTNLQVRLFPHLMVFALPLAAEAIVGLVGASRGWRPNTTRALVGVFSLTGAVLALAAVFKVSNEPLLSDWWAFYLPEERRAVEWIGENVHNNNVWTGYDRRLAILVDWYGDWSSGRMESVVGNRMSAARYALLTSLTEGRALRRGETLPNVDPYQRVYDTGSVQLYYSRPLTPYQR